MRLKTVIMDGATFDRTLIRMAHEIIEKNNGLQDVVLLGIYTRGVYIAKRLSEIMAIIDGKPVKVFTFTPKTDDMLNSENLPLSSTDIEGKKVVIVDDVLHTCKTVNHTIRQLDSYGCENFVVQLAVIVDRGHKKYPIYADFLGKELPSSSTEIISVNIKNYDKTSSVLIYDIKG
ncbi:MAG: bifunctional pyr operon transcriptional regulator/uracil phosphoribosyltransferase PyrR [Clostridia bacterium]|nr:bifunctional pyr operon transcriptional regulator/uracil phosphoribosyltransferase PyrR [Clostridia bacterium]